MFSPFWGDDGTDAQVSNLPQLRLLISRCSHCYVETILSLGGELLTLHKSDAKLFLSFSVFLLETKKAAVVLLVNISGP